MKKYRYGIILAWTLVACNSSKPDNLESNRVRPTTDGLVAYYTFDDHTHDETGNYSATPGLHSPLMYSYADKNHERTVTFSSADRTFAVIDNAFDFEYKTVCLRVKADRIDENPAVVLVSDNPGKKYGLIGVVMKAEDGQKKLFLNVAGNPLAMPAVEGVWYHVAMVGSAKNFAYYINGSMIAKGSFDEYKSSSNGEAVTFLGTSRIRNVFFSGSVDELRVYDRALSAAEIAVIAAY